jgi:hypothetical protein
LTKATEDQVAFVNGCEYLKLMRRLFMALASTLGFVIGGAHAVSEAEFWKWFQSNESALFDFERDREVTIGRLATEIKKVHPSLTFEFGPKVTEKREFVISADGHREAFAKVESLFASAPSLAKWKFIKFRPRRAPADIRYEDISVKASSVSVALVPEAQKVGLIVLIPGYSSAKRESYAGVAFLMLDRALGEYDVETRVGSIDVRAPSGAIAGAVSLLELTKLFDSFIAKR